MGNTELQRSVAARRRTERLSRSALPEAACIGLRLYYTREIVILRLGVARVDADFR